MNLCAEIHFVAIFAICKSAILHQFCLARFSAGGAEVRRHNFPTLLKLTKQVWSSEGTERDQRN